MFVFQYLVLAIQYFERLLSNIIIDIISTKLPVILCKLYSRVSGLDLDNMTDDSNKRTFRGLFAEAVLHPSKKSKDGSLSDKVSNDPQIRTSTPINTEGKHRTGPLLPLASTLTTIHSIIPPPSISPGDIQKIAEQ